MIELTAEFIKTWIMGNTTYSGCYNYNRLGDSIILSQLSWIPRICCNLYRRQSQQYWYYGFEALKKHGGYFSWYYTWYEKEATRLAKLEREVFLSGFEKAFSILFGGWSSFRSRPSWRMLKRTGEFSPPRSAPGRSMTLFYQTSMDFRTGFKRSGWIACWIRVFSFILAPLDLFQVVRYRDF